MSVDWNQDMAATTRQGEFQATEGEVVPAGSLTDLYVRHMPGAIGLAFLLVGDRSLAEDLAQEAFVRLTGRFRHLRAPEAFPSYLRRTVLNLCLSHLRRARVERAWLEKEQGRARDTAWGEPDLTARDELWEALHRLTARQRAAVVLRYYEDLSEHQAAEAMGVSVPAVRSLVARGMETLRRHVRREGGDDGPRA